MEQRRKKIRRTTAPLKEQLNSILKETTKNDHFFDKPLVKKVTKTILISGAVLGVLYLSKYFLSATAGMIKSFKDVRDAWRE